MFSLLTRMCHSTRGQVQLFPQCTSLLSKDATLKLWGRGPPTVLLSFTAIRKIEAGTSLHHIGSALCQQPSQTEGPAAAFDTTWYCTLGTKACSLPQKGKTGAGPVPMATITPPLQSGRHCSSPLLLASFIPSSSDKSVHGAGCV